MITSAQFLNKEESSVQVIYDDSSVLNVPVAPGNRHYVELQEWVTEGNTILSWEYDTTVQNAKDKKVVEIKATAASLISPTDWMVIRAVEGGTEVPTDMTTYRAAVRTASNNMGEEVDLLTSISGIGNYNVDVDNDTWPEFN